MVHALEDIHRLLKSDGILIDIHPVPKGPIFQVLQGDKVIFSEPKRETCSEDVLQAEYVLAECIKNGLFSLDRQAEFDFLIYASSVKELRDYWEEMNEFEDEPKDEETIAREADLYSRMEGIMQAAGPGAEAATYERVRITRLIPVNR